MKLNFKNKVWKYIMFFLKTRLAERYFYQNLNINHADENQKRVLVSYITSGFSFSTNCTHTNKVEAMQIIHFFIRKGFIVDVVNCNNLYYLEELKHNKYDIVFGFGRNFYHVCKRNPNAIKIIYLTELYPRFSKKQEDLRADYYQQRHCRKIKNERTNLYYKEDDFKYADYGILLGNESTKKTFAEAEIPIFTMQPTGLQNRLYKLKQRNISTTKKNFIWFGSNGAIHKGLDILIDAFADISDCNLYVCGLSQKEKQKVSFMKKYKNIFDVGFIDVQSERFLKLVETCSYVILPSCSEGMATSVLTCMNHSLIPIVTENCGIDVFDFGILMNDYHVDYVKQIIVEASKKNNVELENMHKKVYAYSRKQFNIKSFSDNFEKILENILR